jgi:VWFA-related protein
MPFNRASVRNLWIMGAASICAVTLHAQSAQSPPQPQTTFRSSTALVEVDAIMFDKAGKFVPGLKAEDVRLFEDGKPQTIRQFYMVTHTFGSSPDAPVSEFADQADFKTHRLFVILFDESSLANESLARAKKGAEQFVKEQMAEEDAGGIFVSGGMFKSLLTTDKIQLISGIHAVKPAFDNRQQLLASFREFPQIESEIDAQRIAEGSRQVVEQLAASACQSNPLECKADGGQAELENRIQQKANIYVRQARMLTRQTIDNLELVAKGLGKMPGRKTVIFITEGFMVDEFRTTLQMVAGEAARSGVTIYSIDARGLVNRLSPNPDVVMPEQGRSTSFDTGEDAANILTAGTGGFMVRGIDDMGRAFGLIAHDTSTYYVIGYQPENSKMDGKFRKIELKTSRPDVKIRARTGYVATDLPPQQSLWGPGK